MGREGEGRHCDKKRCFFLPPFPHFLYRVSWPFVSEAVGKAHRKKKNETLKISSTIAASFQVVETAEVNVLKNHLASIETDM